MKEFINKLIERLEEEKKYCSYHPHTRDEAIDKAIKIVNQLAEEYKSTEYINCSTDSSTDTSLEEYDQTIDVAELVEKFGQKKVRSNDGWILLADDEDNYPKTFEYVLVQDDIGDKNVACCHPDYDWYISNGEESLKLIGNIVAWQPLPAPYQPKGE